MLHGPHTGAVLYTSIENARNTMNAAQSQLAHDLQMEYSQEAIPTSLLVMVNNES